MSKSNKLSWIQTPATAIICIILDAISKGWAESNLTVGQSTAFIPGFLKFTLTSNTGAAFSIGENIGDIMTVLATATTLVIAYWYVNKEKEDELHVLERVGIGCILGGAIGNLIDRYTKGRVTDFLEFDFMEFPVFNVADALIDVGIGLIVIVHIGFLINHKNQKTEAESKDIGQNQ